MSWLGLEEKVVIVTGGASGIGRACCEVFAETGAKVVVADVDEENGRKVADTLNDRAGGHIFVRTDVSSKISVIKMIETTLEAFGRVEILVNNAGILIPRLLVDPAGKEELTEEIWDKVVGINQKGIFLCAQAAAREMIRSRAAGVIINVASESGLEGSEGQSVYAATKGAI